MLHKQTIIYTGNFSIEKMNAAGKRVFANALIMKRLGYHMVMLGVDNTDAQSVDILSTRSEIDGIEVYHYPGVLFKKSRLNYIAFFKAFQDFVEVKGWCIKSIIGYNSPSTAFFIGKMLKFCHKNGIMYITDVADWLIVDANNPLFRFFRQFDIYIKNAYYSNKSDGIIAISKWLADYYKKKIENVIIVPPLSIQRSRLMNIKENDIPQVVYAGLPFRKGIVIKDPSCMKDRFDVICELFRVAKKKNIKFSFHVFGFDKEDLLHSVPQLAEAINEIDDSIVFHGMTSMENAQEAVAEADYTILIRDCNRMTMAGFPTKVSESISNGTPVITTKTSDIEKYLSEDEEVFFLDCCHKDLMTEKFCSLLKYDKKKRINQKEKCMSNNSFSKDTYVQDFIKLLKD